MRARTVNGVRTYVAYRSLLRCSMRSNSLTNKRINFKRMILKARYITVT